VIVIIYRPDGRLARWRGEVMAPPAPLNPPLHARDYTDDTNLDENIGWAFLNIAANCAIERRGRWLWTSLDSDCIFASQNSAVYVCAAVSCQSWEQSANYRLRSVVGATTAPRRSYTATSSEWACRGTPQNAERSVSAGRIWTVTICGSIGPICGCVITVGLRLGLGMMIVVHKLLEKVTKCGSVIGQF